MAGAWLEDRGDLRLLRAGAHQLIVAAGAERQRQRVEQDGFSRAGLARQHRQPGIEFHAETIDQDDIAYGETRQHRRPSLSGAGAAAEGARNPGALVFIRRQAALAEEAVAVLI